MRCTNGNTIAEVLWCVHGYSIIPIFSALVKQRKLYSGEEYIETNYEKTAWIESADKSADRQALIAHLRPGADTSLLQ